MSIAKKLSIATAGAVLVAFGTIEKSEAVTFVTSNTGNNGLGVENTTDSNYTVNGNAAFVILNNPNWVSNSDSSKWIGPEPNAGFNNVTPGLYTYQTTFNLAGFDPSTAQIAGQLTADNNITNVFINGTSTGITTSVSGFNTFQQFSIDSGFQPGINTLAFAVNNQEGPSGFRAEITGTAEAVPFDLSPTLGSLALVAWGVGIGLQRKLKKNPELLSGILVK